MKIQRKYKIGMALIGIVSLTSLCEVSSVRADSMAASSRPSTGAKVVSAAKMQKESENGSELWSENCGRCHNKRSPEKFSDAQWDVIGRHMRIRANLTGEEERAIVEFLKSAN